VTDEAEQMRRLLFDAAAVNAVRQVLEVARAAGVEAAPVKGVVLARWLYEKVEERPYRDVDVLVARDGLARLTEAVRARGWRIRHHSAEMGELEFDLDRLVIEVHAEVGRRDLTRLSVRDVLARAVVDRSTFRFEVLRIDDVGHLWLLVTNVTKKSYTYANRHQPADLERLLSRLEPRWGDLVARAREGSLVTALRSVSRWMAREHGSAIFSRFLGVLPARPRRLLPLAVRLHNRLDPARRNRLEDPSGLFGLALATLTPDDWRLRARGLERVVRRGVLRRLRRDPG
jgi:hypothetical protein